MKAVIMAGGEGTRLRPLTCDQPKPMSRLCGRPIIEYILELLREHGVDEAAVTLRYLPNAITESFPSGEYGGVKLSFVEEDRPLGTAGSVKNAAAGFGGDFIVISGDAMCDFDLSAAVKFHREKGAAATLVLSRVADPREYGLVVTDPSGAVKGFVEKPGWAQAVTDAVNTGIYILSPSCLELIPDGEEFDFAKNLFPLMMSKGMKIFGFEAEGYWCDIGDIGAYTSCQFDMLDGKVSFGTAVRRQNGIWSKTRMPTGNYTVIPPVYIGENVSIGDFSIIGPYSIIDDGCSIGLGTSIKNSVLLPGSFIGSHCELRGALVCKGGSLKRRAAMYEGSVAGANSVVGCDASVSPGVRIWPGKHVEDGARAAANIKSGEARHGLFDDEGITGEAGADITPEICARIGAAAGSIKQGARIGVGFDGSIAGGCLKSAAAAGVSSTGAVLCDIGACFKSMFYFSLGFFGLDAGLYIRMSGARSVIEIVGPGGLGIGRQAERKMDAAVSTGDYKRCRSDDFKEPMLIPDMKSAYRMALLKSVPTGLLGIKASVKSPNREIQHMLTDIFEYAGCEEGGIRVHIDSQGLSASFYNEDGGFINSDQTLLLGCIVAFENGENVALPAAAPHAADEIARQYEGRGVLRYFDCPADSADSKARALAQKQTWVRDGIENALRVLSYCKTRGITLSQMSDRLPSFAVADKSVGCEGNPGRLLRSFMVGSEPSEGVFIARKNGSVRLNPHKRGTGLRIVAEAADMETAAELCAEFEKKLHGMETETLDRNKN